MKRRRRHLREIPFSFDSFLDIVANVVCVIIRLILVVWVGARSYTLLQHQTRSSTNAAKPAITLPLLTDPLEQELALRRHELVEAQERLLAQLRLLQSTEVHEAGVRENLKHLMAW